MVRYNSWKIGAISIALLFSIVSSAGCLENSDDDRITVTDMLGREVKIPKEVTRVIGLGVGALRFITYLDGAEKVVGMETSINNGSNDQAKTYLIAHPEYKDLPAIGPSHGGDESLIPTVSPQVIFKTTYAEGDCEELQKKIGIPVVGLLGYCGWDESPNLEENIDVLYSQIRLVGKVLGTEEKGEKLVKNVEGIIGDLHNRTKNIPSSERPTTYVGGIPTIGPEGVIQTYSVHAMLDLIGARNIITKQMLGGEKEGELDKDIIPALNPDMMFLYLSGAGSCTLDFNEVFEMDNTSWSQVNAIKEGRVYSIIGHYKYGYNFDTMLANCYWAGKNIYPDEFSDIDPVHKADEIFTLWIGSPVYDQIEVSTGQEVFSNIQFS